MIKYCLLDLDGCIVDWVQGVLDALGIRMQSSDFYKQYKGDRYLQDILGIPIDDFWKPQDESFWANLYWMPDGQEIVRMCEERFGRENIIISTSPSHNRGCWDGKRRWIERHMHRYYHKTEAQMFGSRKWMMANSETILVDDFDFNIEKFEATRGGHVCLVPRLWNSLHPLSDQTVAYVKEVLFDKYKIKATEKCKTWP